MIYKIRMGLIRWLLPKYLRLVNVTALVLLKEIVLLLNQASGAAPKGRERGQIMAKIYSKVREYEEIA